MVKRPVRAVETLPCKLTTDELLQKGVAIADAHAKMAELEKGLDGIKKHFKAEIETCEKDIQKLGTQLQTGKEYRDVECSITYDFDDKKIKTYTRNDTGEVVHEYPISETDLQEELKFREEVERAKNEGEDADSEEVGQVPTENQQN
jgi:hypothetical protein